MYYANYITLKVVCRVEKIVYVTGNYGKYISVKEHFDAEGIEIDFFEHDFNEPEINDIEAVSKAKVLEAYSILGKPCFVADSGFFIDDYPNNPGYPGAFVKRSGVSSNINELLNKMKVVKNRSCQFVDCLTFYDGVNFYSFYGICKGTIAYNPKGNLLNKAKSALWYVFIPENHQKTLAEMTDEERKDEKDGHTSATNEFINWLKNNYSVKPPVLVVKNNDENNR